MTADLLLDAYESLGVLPLSSSSLTSPLHPTFKGDQTVYFPPSFAREVVFLAVDVASSNQHWEKVLDLGMRFNDLTRSVGGCTK